jgi:hypothetical protein
MFLLIDGITATDATKQEFVLTAQDFQGNSLPALKSSGLGTGDTIRIWEFVDGGWQDTGKVLDDGTASESSLNISTYGRYSVDAVLATSGPVSCELHSSGMR